MIAAIAQTAATAALKPSLKTVSVPTDRLGPHCPRSGAHPVTRPSPSLPLACSGRRTAGACRSRRWPRWSRPQLRAPRCALAPGAGSGGKQEWRRLPSCDCNCADAVDTGPESSSSAVSNDGSGSSSSSSRNSAHLAARHKQPRCRAACSCRPADVLPPPPPLLLLLRWCRPTPAAGLLPPPAELR